MTKTMTEWATEINEWCEEKGWNQDAPSNFSDVTAIDQKLMRVVTEIGEMSEANAKNDYHNFCEEMADTFIRLLHLCARLDINIDREIASKMAINRDRPFRHGKRS
jgi:NTP pyrophosphatase (non-canonical NTP hydrolase)